MGFWQRGFRYLWRKRGKSFTLFGIFVVVSTLLLVSFVILQTAEEAGRRMREKTGSKILLQTKDGKGGISEETLLRIGTLPEVSRMNRTRDHLACPSGFAPLTKAASEEPENRMVTLRAMDDTEEDGLFAEEKYRLLEGAPIDRDTRHGLLVDSLLAEANGLSVGDELSFETEEGKRVSGRIVGIFFSGMERRQDDSVFSAYRIENQVFTDQELFEELFGGQEYASVSVYGRSPERLEELHGELEEIVGEEVELSTSDTLYERLKAPLRQVVSVTTLLLALTVVTAAVVVSLLLSMWMRTRQKEFAVILSLGSPKREILFQTFTEAALLFLLSVLAAACLAGILAGRAFPAMFVSGELGALAAAKVEGKHLAALLLFGGALVLSSAGIAALPSLKNNPRDILSRMEE